MKKLLRSLPGWKWLSALYWGRGLDSWVFTQGGLAACRKPVVFQQLPLAYRFFLKTLAAFDRLGFGRLIGRVSTFRLVLRLMTPFGGASDFCLKVGALHVWIRWGDPRGFGVVSEIANPGSDAHTITNLLNSGDLFVDVGGNHGSFSILAAARVGTTGRVVCFEPQPALHGLIQKSFDSNGFTNAQVFPVGLSDCTQAAAALHLPEGSSGGASLHAQTLVEQTATSVTVPLVRGDDLLQPIDFPMQTCLMKMDVEGAELSALKGLTGFMRAKRPQLALEVNPRCLEAAGDSVVELRSLLADLGYHGFSEMGAAETLLPISELQADRVRNILAKPQGEISS